MNPTDKLPPLSDADYLRLVAKHYEDSPAPEIRAHHARMTSIADALATTSATAAPSEPVALSDQEWSDLRRFDETARDDASYDVPKDRMARLARIGAIRRTHGSHYEHTEFGLALLGRDPQPSAKPAGAGDSFVFDSQFLSDVLTAAGLVSNGRRSKNLGERLGKAVMTIRFRATPPAAHAGLTDADSPEAALAEAAKHLMSGRPIKPGEHLAWAINESARGFATTPAPVKAEADELRYSKDTSGGQIKRLRNVIDGIRIYKAQETDKDVLADTLDDIANNLVASYSAGVPEGYKLVPIAAQGAPVMAEAPFTVPEGFVLMPKVLTDGQLTMAQGELMDPDWDAVTCFAARVQRLYDITRPAVEAATRKGQAE